MEASDVIILCETPECWEATLLPRPMENYTPKHDTSSHMADRHWWANQKARTLFTFTGRDTYLRSGDAAWDILYSTGSTPKSSELPGLH
jgi:hypothetical protein